MTAKQIVPKDIFHYTKMETAFEKILLTGKLRLSQIAYTNDPRESKRWNIPKPYWLNPDGTHHANNMLVAKVLDKEVHKVMKEEWKVLCFTLDHPISQEDEDQMKQIQNYYFNRGYAHPRMWAQYAENHKGVCLWFDGEKLDENINRELGKRCSVFKDNIRYDSTPGAIVLPPLPRTIFDDIQKLGQKDAARKYVFDHYAQFFLRKHPDWESEAEYRWLVHSKRLAPEFVSITGAINGVLVGADFPEVYEPSLRKLCKNLKIPAGRISWENGTPIVETESIYKV